MTKPITPGFLTYLQDNNVTTTAMIWTIVTTGGTTYRFTDADHEHVHDGESYSPTNVGALSSLVTRNDLGIDTVELSALITSGGVTREQLSRGDFDHAVVNCHMVDYTSTGSDSMTLFSNWRLGRLSIDDVSVTAEIASPTAWLRKRVTEHFSITCRANFCDDRCKLDAPSYTDQGVVSSVANRRQFVANLGAHDYYSLGVVTWQTGANVGASVDVQRYVVDSMTCVLFHPARYTIVPGDQFTILRGCDKTLRTCKHLYGNVVNFRGEPYTPTGAISVQQGRITDTDGIQDLGDEKGGSVSVTGGRN